MEPVLCPIAPELVDRLKAGWTTDCPVRMWLDDGNVLHVTEIRLSYGSVNEYPAHRDGSAAGGSMDE